MAQSVSSWIELWMAIPAQEVGKPTIATVGIAIHIVLLALATVIATAAQHRASYRDLSKVGRLCSLAKPEAAVGGSGPPRSARNAGPVDPAIRTNHSCQCIVESGF
jgi:hypothetical protein